MKNIRIVNVSVGILQKNTEILVAQRATGVFAGLWEFPGGKIEAGETNEQALVRELKEELSAIVSNIKPFLLSEKASPDGTKLYRLHSYLCDLNSDVRLSVHSAVKWLDILNPPSFNLPWCPPDIPIVEKLKQQIGI